ncbi:MAG: stage II sporulation protein M [Patescibacteria group bacterium]
MIHAWRRARGYFWLGAAVFFAGIVLGALLPALSPGLTRGMLDLMAQKFGPILKQIGELGPAGGVLVIFANNLRAALVTMAAGFTLILPAVALFLNGLLVGLTAVRGRAALGGFLLTVLPHGVLELPALFLASALGWRMGAVFWREVLGRFRSGELRELLGDLKRLGPVLLALLAAASLIEILVSAWLAPAGRFY